MGFSDQFLDLKREIGIASIHFTGGGSNYMPWWAGLGYVWGAYGTSEEGGTISDPATLSRELAWMLLNGQGHHNFYYSALDYMRLEQRTGWFTQNRRLLEMMGKATWQKPPIAVLRSARCDLYFPYSDQTYAWDVGFGPLQAAHYSNVYVTEAEIKAGLAGQYPVVFDTATSVIDDELLAGIDRYVRAGGTFVAVCDTGRHSLLEADAWPIRRLTGMKVLGRRENGRVTIAPGNPLFKRLSGMSFDSDGTALQWTGTAAGPKSPEPSNGRGLSQFRAPCEAWSNENGTVPFRPAEPGNGAVLARWEDGTAAVAMRTLGRGRIVLLGSSFWRSESLRTATGTPLQESVRTTFFGDLFSALGIDRQAEIDSEDVWVRRFVTKNGLQQWVMAYNSGRAPQKGLTLSFPLKARPSQVVDMVSNKPVEFVWEKGIVRIPNLDLNVNAIRVFGVDTTAGLDAVEHWFAEKRHYESRPVARRAVEQLPSPPPTALVMDTFRFRQSGANAADDRSWLTEPADGPAWKEVGHGFWDEMGYAARGIGYYRRTFRVPQSWSGRRVLLAFVSFDYPVFLEHADVYVNGRAAGEYRGHRGRISTCSTSPRVHPGENALAVRVEAKEVRGGYVGQLVAFPLEKLEAPAGIEEGLEDFSRTTASSYPRTSPGCGRPALGNRRRFARGVEGQAGVPGIRSGRSLGGMCGRQRSRDRLQPIAPPLSEHHANQPVSVGENGREEPHRVMAPRRRKRLPGSG